MNLVTLKLDWIALTNLINKVYTHGYKYSFLYKIMTQSCANVWQVCKKYGQTWAACKPLGNATTAIL